MDNCESKLMALSASPAPPVSITANRQLAEILSQKGFTVLQQFMSYQTTEPGAYLWREGEAANSLALILSGKLEILKETEFPKHPFLTGIFTPGTVVGEDGFLDERPRNTTVRALEPCDLLVMNRNSFEQLEQRYPAIANLILKWLLNLISNRLHHSQNRLAAIF